MDDINAPMKKFPTITVGELRRELADLPDSAELFFANGLTYYGIKKRGPNYYQFDFNQLIYRDAAGTWRIEGR